MAYGTVKCGYRMSAKECVATGGHHFGETFLYHRPMNRLDNAEYRKTCTRCGWQEHVMTEPAATWIGGPWSGKEAVTDGHIT
jgi:hypothetical protein